MAVMQRLTVNFAGQVKRVTRNGREWLVAPMSLINPGVLNGSKGALFYPLILLCAGLTVMLFIVTAVIPQFAEIYMRANIPLPIPTLIVYKLGTAIKHYWYLLIVCVIAAAIGIRYYFTTRTGILLMDTVKLRLPIIGPASTARPGMR